MKVNPLTQVDWYKPSHRPQYPVGTEMVYSNFTPRSGNIFRQQWPEWDGKIVWAGGQGFIKEFLIEQFNEGFFNQPEDKVIAAYKHRCDTSLGEGAVDMEPFRALHRLGYLPIEIKSLPEGSLVPEKVPVLTIKNTLPEFFWLTNYLETVMSAALWKISTNATIAYQYRKLLTEFAVETGAPLDFVPLQGHDFSMRGLGYYLEAGPSGFGHLLSFVGTDTIPAIDYAENYYNADGTKELIGCSVPASEHSVMTIGGVDGEFEIIKRLITEVHPTGIVSLVLDGFHLWDAITKHLVALKEEILARKPNALGLAKVVVRPDSGDPVKILCGYTKDEYTYYPSADNFTEGTYVCNETDRELSEAERKGVIELLWDIFGGTQTAKGYRVLHERIGAIYGDSITLPRAKAILAKLKAKGFASCNIVFGIGSFTYQYNTRDLFGWAAKCTYAIVKGIGRAVYKDPVTDKGNKKSARGLLAVFEEGTEFKLKDDCTWEYEAQGELQTIFLNSQLTRETSCGEIRNRLWGSQ